MITHYGNFPLLLTVQTSRSGIPSLTRCIPAWWKPILPHPLLCRTLSPLFRKTRTRRDLPSSCSVSFIIMPWSTTPARTVILTNAHSCLLSSPYMNKVDRLPLYPFRSSIPSLSLRPDYSIPLASASQLPNLAGKFSTRLVVNNYLGGILTHWLAQASLGALIKLSIAKFMRKW